MAITFDQTSPVAFGNVVIGHPAQQTVTITNSGGSDISIALTGSAFSMLPSTVKVPANANGQNGTATVTITFNPAAAQAYTGSISGDSSTLSFTGTGVPLLYAPPSLDFGDVALGSSPAPTKSLTITNSGSTAATLTGPSAPFTWSPSTASVAANSSVTVTVTYTPTAVGSSSSSISGGSGSCALSGKGVSLTFDPPSIDFASLDTGGSTTATVTITKAGSGSVSITGPSAPYTWDLSSPYTLSDTSKTVTITFAPTAVRSYSSSLSGGGATCALAGSGRGASDEFETEGDSTDTDGGGGVPGTAGTKYYEIMVPNFALNSSNSTPGTSFLRIGNFNPSPPASTGSGLKGEAKSWQLAKIVGDAQAIQSAEPQQDLAPDANPVTPSYKGDPNYLLGFCDDTRYRLGDSASAWAARRDETKKLLTKGGWWDHSDGNRISTTAGDKIEVIQGNYKMLVLGRLDSSSDAGTLGANTLITDISGGLMTENGPSPTHCIKSIEFSQTEGGTWEVYQNNGIGHVYSSFYGDTVDIFFGPHKSTWTGKASDDYSTWNDDDKEVYDVYKTSLAMHPNPTALTSQDDPAVLDHMWASKILDYKRVSGEIKSDVHAGSIDGYTEAGTIKANTVADAITNLTTAKGVITNVTSSPFIWNFNQAINTFSFVFGFQENIAIGPQLNVAIAPKLDISIAPWGQFSLDLNGFHNLKTEAVDAENRLVGLTDMLVAVHNRVADVVGDIADVNTRITDEATFVDAQVTSINANFDIIAAELNLA